MYWGLAAFSSDNIFNSKSIGNALWTMKHQFHSVMTFFHTLRLWKSKWVKAFMWMCSSHLVGPAGSDLAWLLRSLWRWQCFLRRRSWRWVLCLKLALMFTWVKTWAKNPGCLIRVRLGSDDCLLMLILAPHCHWNKTATDKLHVMAAKCQRNSSFTFLFKPLWPPHVVQLSVNFWYLGLLVLGANLVLGSMLVGNHGSKAAPKLDNSPLIFLA